jgi:hypothetical protein
MSQLDERIDQGGAMRLRERGIYCLPNGRELIVISNTQDGVITMRDSRPSEQSEYELERGGRLLTSGSQLPGTLTT